MLLNISYLFKEAEQNQYLGSRGNKARKNGVLAESVIMKSGSLTTSLAASLPTRQSAIGASGNTRKHLLWRENRSLKLASCLALIPRSSGNIIIFERRGKPPGLFSVALFERLIHAKRETAKRGNFDASHNRISLDAVMHSQFIMKKAGATEVFWSDV